MSYHKHLPSGWVEAALRDVAEINPPNPTKLPADDALVSFVPMASVEALTGCFDASYGRPWSQVRKGYTRFQDGDVLFAKITPCMENGKSAVARALLDGVGAGSTEFHVLRPTAGLSAELLLHYVLQEEFRKSARAQMTGTAGQLRVPSRFLEDQTIPLPPPCEQHRIVEAIESYFTRLDAAVATLERVQRNLKRYRASVLKAAVEGRLVPTEAELARAEGRTYESALVLLERILGERRHRWEEVELAKMTAKGKVPKDDKWKAKYVEPVAPDTSDLPDLPEGWCWASLAQLFETITDGDHQPPPQSPEGIPFLVIGNVKSGCVDLSNTRFVPQTYYDSLHEHRKPRNGDLLYTVTGSYGIPVRVVNDLPFCVQRHIAILRPTVFLNSTFLYYVLQSQTVFEQAASKATGTAQKTVGLESLRSFVVPFPPSSEQDRMVASLDNHFSLSDNTTTDVLSSVLRGGRLRQSILKWAFEGRLVDQDPTDEPASALLERIRAERLTARTAPTDAASDSKRPKSPGRRKARTSNA